MLEAGTKIRERSGPPIGVVVAGIVLLAGLAGGYFLYQKWQDEAPLLPILTEEAKAYLPNLDLSDVEMQAKESFLEQTIVTIEGNITNNGERTVEIVDVTCVFRDPYGREVSRELVRIVGRSGNALEPGETQPFRLAFDNAPVGWNQIMPDLYIAQIVFED